MKVLVVDDNSHNRYLSEVLLKAHGDEVVTAANGVEALEKLRELRPDLIVSDIMMPRMDGYRFCRECKRDDALKTIPFIFATAAYTDDKDEAFALSLGADAFIRRPVEPGEFIHIIEAVTATRKPLVPVIGGQIDETHYWAGYADRLVNRLEKKILDLESEIAARKRAEGALRESDERYRSLVAALFEGVVLLDRDGSIRACNASAERMFAFGSKACREPLYDPAAPPIHEDGTAFTRDTCPSSVTLSTGNPCHNVIMGFAVAGGARRWFSVNSQPLRHNADEKPYAVVVSFVDITEQRRLRQELERQARTDALTGALNRWHFMELARQELVSARRYHHPLSLLMIDIDRFKAVNDTYGHQAGDLALQTLVRVCREVLRDVDLVARLGGEEFAVLLPETPVARAAQVAERLRQSIAASSIFADGLAVRITVSIGITCLSDGEADVETLLQGADRALYEAKETGRDRVCIADPPRHPASAEARVQPGARDGFPHRDER